MQRLVIANTGITDRGKTQALNKVIEELTDVNNKAEVVKEKSLDNGDVRVILLYKGKKIGIETQGDPGVLSRLSPSLDYFVQENCEVIVCACRTSGNTYEAVEDLQKQHGYKIIWYSNPYVESIKEGDFPDKVKAVYAKSVREMIEKKISGEI
jgi:hypothetical protein